jgi:hypothetical protein
MIFCKERRNRALLERVMYLATKRRLKEAWARYDEAIARADKARLT